MSAFANDTVLFAIAEPGFAADPIETTSSYLSDDHARLPRTAR